MSYQTDMFKDFVNTPSVHSHENNSESTKHLQDNTQKFSSQCSLILHHLKLGRKLTRRDAMVEFGILDFIKRIDDLKHKNNIDVKDQWVTDSKGKKLYKEYFL